MRDIHSDPGVGSLAVAPAMGDAATSQAPRRKRPRLTVGLLMLLIALFAYPLFWAGLEIERRRERAAWVADWHESNAVSLAKFCPPGSKYYEIGNKNIRWHEERAAAWRDFAVLPIGGWPETGFTPPEGWGPDVASTKLASSDQPPAP
jgi:hypothetical protein